MKTTFGFVLIFFCLASFAQNYVKNPSFEDIDDCAFNLAQLNLSPPWQSATLGTPDLFNSCDTMGIVSVPQNFISNCFPLDGDNYAGIHFVYYNDYREYIKTELSECMRAGVTYEFSMWVALSEIHNKPISSQLMGVHIGEADLFFNRDIIIDQIQPNVKILDTIMISTPNQWVQIRGEYEAKGNEKYLILGNFTSGNQIPITGNSRTAYLLIDDIRLENPEPHVIINCQNKVCRGDSTLLQANKSNSRSIEWRDASGQLIGTDTAIWVSPEQTTIYTLYIENTPIQDIEIQVIQNPKELSNVSVSCGSSPYKSILETSSDIEHIVWSNGAKNKKVNYLEFGEHWVYLENSFGCKDTLEFSTDSCQYYVCEGDSLIFESDFDIDNLNWFNRNNLNNPVSIGPVLKSLPQSNSTYYLMLNDSILDSLKVYFVESKEFELDIDCRFEPSKVRIKNPFGSVTWSNGETQSFSSEFYKGNHSVVLTDLYNCAYQKDFSVPLDCDDILICYTDSVQLKTPEKSTGYWVEPIKNRQIEAGDSVFVKPKLDTKYFFFNGEDYIDSINVLVHPERDFKLLSSCEDGIKNFEVINWSGDILWDNGERDIQKQAFDTDNKWVQIIDENSCIVRKYLRFDRLCSQKLSNEDFFIPNIITPNADGKNEYLEILAPEFTRMRVQVYNRWGQKVYESYPYLQNWNASQIPSGDYFILLSGDEIDGKIKTSLKVLR